MPLFWPYFPPEIFITKSEMFAVDLFKKHRRELMKFIDHF